MSRTRPEIPSPAAAGAARTPRARRRTREKIQTMTAARGRRLAHPGCRNRAGADTQARTPQPRSRAQRMNLRAERKDQRTRSACANARGREIPRKRDAKPEQDAPNPHRAHAPENGKVLSKSVEEQRVCVERGEASRARSASPPASSPEIARRSDPRQRRSREENACGSASRNHNSAKRQAPRCFIHKLVHRVVAECAFKEVVPPRRSETRALPLLADSHEVNENQPGPFPPPPGGIRLGSSE